MAHMITKIAEYGIIINTNKEFLILRFSKDVNAGEKWIFPGGRLDNEEKPKLGLLREIKEETNLGVEIIQPCDVSMWGIGEDHRYAIFFLCKPKNKNEVKLSHEHQEYKWCSFKDLDKISFHDISFRRILENAFTIITNRPDYI